MADKVPHLDLFGQRESRCHPTWGYASKTRVGDLSFVGGSPRKALKWLCSPGMDSHLETKGYPMNDVNATASAGRRAAWIEPEVRSLEVGETNAAPNLGADVGGNAFPDCQRS
jgi:hypothetical protein